MAKVKNFIKQAGYYNGIASVIKSASAWPYIGTALASGGAGLLAGKYLSDSAKSKSGQSAEIAAEQLAQQSAQDDYIEMTPNEYNALMQMYYQNPYYFTS